MDSRAPARQRIEAIAGVVRLAAATALVVALGAAAGGVALAVAGRPWAAAVLFLFTGAGFATSVLGWLTDDGIGVVLHHPWRADLAWALVVLLFGIALPIS